MATQNDTTQQAEAAAERIRELNERVLEFGKKAGIQFLEAYESNMKTFADYGDKFADSAQAEWVATAVRAQTDFTRELTQALQHRDARPAQVAPDGRGERHEPRPARAAGRRQRHPGRAASRRASGCHT